MKRLLLSLAAIVLASTLPAGAANYVNNVVVLVNKSDAWVWVTAYNRWGEINGRAYCVAPGGTGSYGHGSTYLYEVRVEVTHQNCSHPVYLDQRRGYPYGHDSMTYTYYVHGSNGRYVYNNTP